MTEEQPKPKYVTGSQVKDFVNANFVSFQYLKDVMQIFPGKVREYATNAVKDYLAPIGFFRRLLGIPEDAKIEELKPADFSAGYESLPEALEDLKKRLEKLEQTAEGNKEAPLVDLGAVEPETQTLQSLNADATELLKIIRGDEQNPGLLVRVRGYLEELRRYTGVPEEVKRLRLELYGEDGNSGLRKELQDARASIAEIDLELQGTETQPGVRGAIEGYELRLRTVNEGLEKAERKAGEVAEALEKLEAAKQEPATPSQPVVEASDFRGDMLDLFESFARSLGDEALQQKVKEARRRYIK